MIVTLEDEHQIDTDHVKSVHANGSTGEIETRWGEVISVTSNDVQRVVSAMRKSVRKTPEPHRGMRVRTTEMGGP